MKEGFFILISVWWVHHAATQGTIDSIVNDAIEVALGGGAGGTPQQAAFGLPTGAAPSPAAGPIPASKYTKHNM